MNFFDEASAKCFSACTGFSFEMLGASSMRLRRAKYGKDGGRLCISQADFIINDDDDDGDDDDRLLFSPEIAKSSGSVFTVTDEGVAAAKEVEPWTLGLLRMLLFESLAIEKSIARFWLACATDAAAEKRPGTLRLSEKLVAW